MKIQFRGCFDQDCCGGSVFGYDGDCVVCGYNTYFSGSIDSDELYENWYKWGGKELLMTCDECGTQYQGMVIEDEWLDNINFKKIT